MAAPVTAPLAPSGVIPDFECVDVEQVPAPQQAAALDDANRPSQLLAYFGLGIVLGVLFVMSEVASWYRIYEMFRFESVHMFGVIGVAVVVAAFSLWIIRRFDVRTLHGDTIEVAPKLWGTSRLRGARYWLGGTIFGLGWALIGACPGPMFALAGAGYTVLLAGIAAALLGTWAYGVLQHRLPH
jgi:uncharacterized membrane protein YedE/YeeE